MSLARWNDDRMDDLHRWLESLAKRVDNIGTIVAAHDLQLRELQADRRTRMEQKWALLLVIMTVVIGQIANVALQTIHTTKAPVVQVRIVK